jgi:Cu/Ag efflux pump CusA
LGCERPHPAVAPPVTFQVWVDAPAYGTLELERSVTIPLELALSGSRSLTTMDRVVLTVEDQGDLFAARQRAMEAINAVQLPEGMFASLGPVTTDRDLIVRYALRSPKRQLVELRSLEDWNVRARLLQLPGIADVSTCGGAVEQIDVVADLPQLAARGLYLGDLRDALASATGGFRTLEEISNAPIRGGKVADVAKVVRGAARSACSVATTRGSDVVEGLVWLRTGSDRAAATTATLAALATSAKELDVAITPLETKPAIRVGFTAGDPDHELEALGRVLSDGPDELVEYGQSDGGFATALPDEFRIVVPTSVRGARAQRAGEVVRPVLVGETTMVQIAGPELDTLANLAATVPGWSHAPQMVEEQRVTLDRAKATSLGISAGDLTFAVATSRGGTSAAALFEQGRRLDVVLRVAATPMLTEVRVAAASGLVPLSAIATVAATPVPRSISRAAGSRIVEIEVEGRLAQPPVVALPPGYTITIESHGRASGS